MKKALSVLIISAAIIFSYVFTTRCVMNYELNKNIDPDTYVKESLYRKSGAIYYSGISISKNTLTAALSSYYYGMNREYINSRKKALREKSYNDTYQQVCDDLQYRANIRYEETNSKNWIKKVILTHNKRIIYQADYKKRYAKPQ